MTDLVKLATFSFFFSKKVENYFKLHLRAHDIRLHDGSIDQGV